MVKVKKEGIHQAVFNSAAMIVQIIREEMTEQEFHEVLIAQVASPFENITKSDTQGITRSLTQMAGNLRTLQ